MSKRKKLEPFTGTGYDPENKLVVQKSRPLFELWQSDLSLAEFKILDLYLARIDSRKPEHRSVVLEKGEIEDALGVTKISTDNLIDRLMSLGKAIKIPDTTKKNGFRLMWLLEEAQCELDENDQWKITLECSSKAMKYFFNIENLGYFRYKLRCISSLRSRYSYVLFGYLESNRYRTPWKVDIAELKKILNCDTEETYKTFKRFNDLILKRCQKELCDKTECNFTYETIKKGRSVVALRFSLESISSIEPLVTNQISFDDNCSLIDTTSDSWDPIAFLAEACNCSKDRNTVVPEFDHTQMNEIFQILVTIPESKLPLVDGGIEFQRYHYLAQKYAALCSNDRPNRPIKHRYNYFLQLLRADAGL